MLLLNQISVLWGVYKAVDYNEESKGDQVNQKKEKIQVNWCLGFLLSWVAFLGLGGSYCRVGPDFKKDDHIEEESDKDKEDAGEDPGGERGQSVRWSCGESGGEEVDQHLGNNRRVWLFQVGELKP